MKKNYITPEIEIEKFNIFDSIMLIGPSSQDLDGIQSENGIYDVEDYVGDDADFF